MNLSSTSSFLEYTNSTSTGGNSLYTLHEVNTFFIDEETIKIPNFDTLKAINDINFDNTIKFDNADDCLRFLND